MKAVIGVPVASVWESPTAPRAVDAPALAGEPDMATWLSQLGTQERLDLLGRLCTQGLLGEEVAIVDERQGWSEVRLPRQSTSLDPDGYPGWVRSDHLSALPSRNKTNSVGSASDASSEQSWVVAARLLLTWHDRRCTSPAELLSMGTEVFLDDVNSHQSVVSVRTVRGQRWIERDAISVGGTLRFMVTSAQRFLGVQYLWGGLSGWGVDCSGLIHLSSRAAGLDTPRDCSDQRRFFGAPPPCAGTPVFFRNSPSHPQRPSQIHHVGLALSSDLMLHAPRSGRVVEVLPLGAEPYASELEIEETCR